MRINQNIMAFNAYRNLSTTNSSMAKSLEKLSSGFRINRAADDAAGLVISQGLRAQVSGLRQATRNAQDGISVVQTAEGALNEVHNMLNRMRELAVQAANTATNDQTARTAANQEMTALREEIDRIATATTFGTMKLLDGSFGKTATELTGFDADNSITVASGDTINVTVTGGSGAVSVALSAGTFTGSQFASMVEGAIRGALNGTGDAVDAAAAASLSVTAETVGAGSAITISNLGSAAVAVADGTGTPLADLDVDPIGTLAAASGTGGRFQVGAYVLDTIDVSIDAVSAEGLEIDSLDLINDASAAITAIDAAINAVSTSRGNLGAIQNRFESTIANLQVSTENLAASESRIRDTDMALEMTNYTRNQILQQAGTAMLGQANQIPQSVLRLIMG